MAVNTKNSLVGPFTTKHYIFKVVFSWPEPGAYRCTDITAHTLTDAAKIKSSICFGGLPGFAVNVLNDIVRAYGNAAAALTATASGDHVVHHIFKTTVAERCCYFLDVALFFTGRHVLSQTILVQVKLKIGHSRPGFLLLANIY